jgi:hypothetical protein
MPCDRRAVHRAPARPSARCPGVSLTGPSQGLDVLRPECRGRPILVSWSVTPWLNLSSCSRTIDRGPSRTRERVVEESLVVELRHRRANSSSQYAARLIRVHETGLRERTLGLVELLPDGAAFELPTARRSWRRSRDSRVVVGPVRLRCLVALVRLDEVDVEVPSDRARAERDRLVDSGRSPRGRRSPRNAAPRWRNP